MIITIDGPAGSGKSTAARKLAEALGYAYLDTGATYRAVTLAALRAGTDLTDAAALADLARRLNLNLEADGDRLRVLLDGQDVTRDIRSAEVTDNAHYVARAGEVRSVLVDLQRRLGERLAGSAGGVVSEGRDQGTVVFPDADVKFYLDAEPEVRARRRHEEMLADGEDVAYEDVLEAICTRDGRDRSRAVAPLTRPDDAVDVDTSGREIAEVTDLLAGEVRRRR
jgi:cytidylate kinase